jgi:hypothetical protein
MLSLRVLGNGTRNFRVATKIRARCSELHCSLDPLCELKLKGAGAGPLTDFVPMVMLHLSKSCFDLFDL